MKVEIKEEELLEEPSSSLTLIDEGIMGLKTEFEEEIQYQELDDLIDDDEDLPGTSQEQELFLSLDPMKNSKNELIPEEVNGKKKTKKTRTIKQPRYHKTRGKCPPDMSKNAYYYQRLKDRMSAEEWAMRLQKQRDRRQQLTPEMKEEILRKSRERRKELKAQQTPEQKAEEAAKISARKARLLSNPEKREKYRDIARKHYLKRVKVETEEDKNLRRKRAAEFKRNRVKTETPEERELRLLKLRLGAQKRYARLRLEKELLKETEEILEFDESKPGSSNCSTDV
ncbi:unnamed protein product, partial [Mesorhabditis belari]|uniref:Uncharacterized protein n=1 Tax=Mesorhabditis belari TaxID=2138241 RepID=A0AAF3FDS8_9BILA